MKVFLRYFFSKAQVLQKKTLVVIVASPFLASNWPIVLLIAEFESFAVLRRKYFDIDQNKKCNFEGCAAATLQTLNPIPQKCPRETHGQERFYNNYYVIVYESSCASLNMIHRHNQNRRLFVERFFPQRFTICR